MHLRAVFMHAAKLTWASLAPVMSAICCDALEQQEARNLAGFGALHVVAHHDAPGTSWHGAAWCLLR